MQRFVGCLVGCLAVMLVWAVPAGACTCLTPPSPSQGAEAVDVVFVGTAADVRRMEADGWLYGAWKSLLGADHLYEFETLRVAFDVGTAIKGTESGRIMLETPASTELCGVLFREGENISCMRFTGRPAS